MAAIVKDEFGSVENMVLYCFAHYPDTKNNDRLLMLSIWSLQGLKLNSLQRHQFLHVVFSPETIRRCRQKIQEEARRTGQKYNLPNEETERERRMKESEVRQYLQKTL